MIGQQRLIAELEKKRQDLLEALVYRKASNEDVRGDRLEQEIAFWNTSTRTQPNPNHRNEFVFQVVSALSRQKRKFGVPDGIRTRVAGVKVK